MSTHDCSHLSELPFFPVWLVIVLPEASYNIYSFIEHNHKQNNMWFMVHLNSRNSVLATIKFKLELDVTSIHGLLYGLSE